METINRNGSFWRVLVGSDCDCDRSFSCRSKCECVKPSLISVIVTQHHLPTIVTQHPRLSGNKLSAVKGNVFANLNNLNVLNLSHNRFHFVPIIAQNRFSLPLTYNCYCNASFLQDNDDWGEKSQESEQPESFEVTRTV